MGESQCHGRPYDCHRQRSWTAIAVMTRKGRVGCTIIALYTLFYAWVIQQHHKVYTKIGTHGDVYVSHARSLMKQDETTAVNMNEISTIIASTNKDYSNSTSNALLGSTRSETAVESSFQRNALTSSNRNNTQLRPVSSLPPEIHSLSGLTFIPSQDLRQWDYFSDSWLIPKSRFLELDLHRIGIVEDAALVAVGPNAYRAHSYSRMTYDWMDFCVEHLSKWWGVLQILRGGDPGHVFDHVIGMLDKFMKEKVQSPTVPQEDEAQPLQETIAMVAFAPYSARRKEVHDPDGIKGRQLTAYSLGATIASLYQAGFGRVVVVGVNENDVDYIQDTVDLLITMFDGEKIDNNDDDGTLLAKLGKTGMEITHVHVTDATWVSNGKVERNVPRAAIFGMWSAMSGKLNRTETSRWLGRHQNAAGQRWKYVYLTEPDTILHIRKGLLPQFRTALQEGLSLFPHRLHPLPHQDDLPETHSLNPGVYIPSVGHFSNITNINAAKENMSSQNSIVSCCDGGRQWPGHDGWEKKNGCRPWWTCGFHKVDVGPDGSYNHTEIVQRHERLQLYPMMRLENGIGAIFASTNQGRRCYPSKIKCTQ